MGDFSDEDDVEKEVTFLAKNFRKFLKMKNNGKSFGKGKFSSFKNDKREFKKKDGKDSSSTQGIVCYVCNGHGHLKKECPNYLRGKGKVFATTFSDLESSNSDAKGECDGEGNYSAFMAITAVESRDELSELVDELGVHSEGEEVDDSEDEDVYLNEGERNLQEVYDALLEDCGKYAKVAKNVVRKMKKIEEEHRSTLVQLKEAKSEVEELNEELLKYSKIKFLELEIIQENVKVERISTKKLDSVLSSKKSSNGKTGLGYTGEGSSSSRPKKEVKFVSVKNVEKPKVEKPKIETPIIAKRTIGPKPKEKREIITQKSKGTSSEAFLSSLWCARAHKAKFLQASSTQEG